MIPAKTYIRVPWLPIILSAIHIVLFVLTFSFGKTASGGNPFVCVDLPWSFALFAEGHGSRIFPVGFLATAWWYFIGHIGWSSRSCRMSREGSMAGAFFVPLICTFDSYAMISQFRPIVREPNFSAVDVAIYILAAALVLGGFISAAYAWIAALGLYGSR
jgi:hypothetical protein